MTTSGKNLCFSLCILGVLALCVTANELTPEAMCGMAHQNLQKEAQKFVNYIEQNDYRSAFTYVITMQYVLPKVSEICVNSSSNGQDLTVQENLLCADGISQVYQLSKKILESEPSQHANTYAHFEALLIATTSVCDSSQMSLIQTSKQGFESAPSKDDNAMRCILCDIFVTLATNDAVYKRIEISNYISQHFCKIFPKNLSGTCSALVTYLGPYIISGVANKDNSDVICRKAKACTGIFSQCNLHSASQSQIPVTETQESKYPSVLETLLQQFKVQAEQISKPSASLSPWQWILDIINNFADNHQAVVDFDQDGFSTIPNFRGYNWRGKDCNDFLNTVYPGRKVFEGDQTIDFDCNGIYGVNTVTGNTYKEELCSHSDRLGVIVIGDSAGAHFSIPPKYFNVTMWQKDTFHDLLYRASDELDLPHMSASSGYEQNPLVHSFYQRVYELNRCNRNDYQNLGVNGARSSHLHDFQAIRRNQTYDHPQLIVFELIGNDVCSAHQSLSSFTTEQEFRENILKAWNFLDTVVPKGSHMVVWGLGDGDVLYDLLEHRIHPLFVKYTDFYDYLNCLDSSPCWGWMNTNSTIREATTQRAHELNNVYKDIIATTTFNNFDIQFYDLPINEAIARAEQDGYQGYEIIEPVDGFHPNQLANFYFSEIIWEKLLIDRPDWIPAVNPNNKLIDALFSAPPILLEA